MNIRELIKDLLLKHNVVVLPGIGGFVTEYEEAKVDAKENKLSPPKKNVRFDTNLIKDESSLIEKHLISTFKISESEASEKMRQFLDDIKKDMSKETAVEIPSVGYLKTNDKNEIIFEPKLGKNLLLDSLGFDSFSHKTFNKIKLEQTSPQPKSNVNKNKNRSIAIFKPYIIIPASAVVLIFILIFFTDLDKSISNLNFMKLFAGKDKGSIEHTDDTGKTELGKKLDEQTDPSEALKLTDENNMPNDDKYANCTEFIIIAGSFTQFKNAEELRQKLTFKGYEPEIILSGEKNYRVALKTFENRQTALQELEILKDKEKDLSVWLLSI